MTAGCSSEAQTTAFATTLATPQHDKEMAADFLAILGPTATKHTFQFFSDGDERYAEVFHGSLNEVWPKVEALNTPCRRVGVFVTVNETDGQGRRRENIIRPRAVFADADTADQLRRTTKVLGYGGANLGRSRAFLLLL
jgi:hypothetical protein